MFNSKFLITLVSISSFLISGSAFSAQSGSTYSARSDSAHSAHSESNNQVPHPKPTKIIGINQIVEHPALMSVREGILLGLKKHGFEEGKNLKVLYENAQGNIAVSTQIANKLLSEPIDVAVGISTPSAQSLLFTAERLQKRVPIVFAAVSDPETAKLVPGKIHYPITGILDTPHIEGLLELMQKMLPNIKTLGIVYNSSESNSVAIVKRFTEALQKQGIKTVIVTVNNSNEVKPAVQSLMGKVDALYFPQDNTVVSAIQSVIKVTENSQSPLPIFTHDPSLVEKGVLAAVGFDYQQIGLEASDSIAKILNGELANTIPSHAPKELKAIVNVEVMKKLGIIMPKDLQYSKISG